jgi:hypothetical protein
MALMLKVESPFAGLVMGTATASLPAADGIPAQRASRKYTR